MSDDKKRAGSMIVILAEIERLRPLTENEKEVIRRALWPLRPGTPTPIRGTSNFDIGGLESLSAGGGTHRG